MIEVERPGALRIGRRDDLGDRRAHRRADQVRLLDSQRVEQADAVGSHRFERVGQRGERLTGEQRADVGPRQVGAVRRPATISVVETQYAKTTLDQQFAQSAVPARG